MGDYSAFFGGSKMKAGSGELNPPTGPPRPRGSVSAEGRSTAKAEAKAEAKAPPGLAAVGGGGCGEGEGQQVGEGPLGRRRVTIKCLAVRRLLPPKGGGGLPEFHGTYLNFRSCVLIKK